MKSFIVTIFFTLLYFNSYSQDFSNRSISGKKYATQAIKEAIGDKKNQPFHDTLIKDKRTAISVVEPILFQIYGKENVIDKRPYECYLINGYWYISGTLPKNTPGGSFEIILSSINGKVIRLTHGK